MTRTINTTTGNSLIFKNTIILYLRMILLMGVSLFTSRIILRNLGVTDYGLNNVIAGVILVFSYINNSMSASTSRFLTFELGRNNTIRLNNVYNNAVIIHLCLSLIVLLLGETIGIYIVNYSLNIPEERIVACNILFQLVIIMSMLSINLVPLNALVISHEKMGIYAYIGIFDSLAKLGVAYALGITSFDKLVLYGFLNCIISLLNFLFYLVYCKKKYADICKCNFHYNSEIIKQMLGFTSWSLIGSTATMFRNSGVNILINIFFGPAINAANAIAYQINSAVTNFTSNFTMAMNPQIIKMYASSRNEELKKLLFRGGKVSFFLLILLCNPLLFETEFILNLWLGDYPDYTPVFTRLVLILTLVEILNQTVGAAVRATGEIRNYQLVLSGILCLNFPFSFMLYKLGFAPYSALLCSVILSTICLFIRLYFIQKLLKISWTEYLVDVILRCWLIAGACFLVPLFFHQLLNYGLSRFLIVTISSLMTSILIFYFWGFSTNERITIQSRLYFLLKRF